MNLLAIDTATEACSAAILSGGGIVERYQLAPREHNRLILPMIESVLAEAGLAPAQLDAIAFGRGPGSFTGVRIAAGVVQGIALGLDLPVVPVSTLAALALDAMESTDARRAFACIDARMQEVYWGVYDRLASDEVSLAGSECVCPPNQIPAVADDTRPGVGCGSGWATYAAIITLQLDDVLVTTLSDRFPRAGIMSRLAAVMLRQGHAVPPEQALPVYLRDQVAKKPAKVGGIAN